MAALQPDPCALLPFSAGQLTPMQAIEARHAVRSYIDEPLEKIVGLQTEKPLKRALMVNGGIRMAVAAEGGGFAALTGAIVIVTGIVGALLAETVCKLFHITDPIAKGVGIGTAAHAVGTSKALQMGDVEGAMSGLSIAVAGVLTAVLCPVFVNFIG